MVLKTFHFVAGLSRTGRSRLFRSIGIWGFRLFRSNYWDWGFSAISIYWDWAGYSDLLGLGVPKETIRRSGTWYLNYGTWTKVPELWYLNLVPELGTWTMVPELGTWTMVPELWYLNYGTWTWYLNYGTWTWYLNLVPELGTWTW